MEKLEHGNETSLNGVGGLHGTEETIVEDGHEEALGQVIQVLSESEDIVALPAGGGVESASLESGAETADGGTVVSQSHRLLEDTCRPGTVSWMSYK